MQLDAESLRGLTVTMAYEQQLRTIAKRIAFDKRAKLLFLMNTKTNIIVVLVLNLDIALGEDTTYNLEQVRSC